MLSILRFATGLLIAVPGPAGAQDDGPVIAAGQEAYFGGLVDEEAALACGWQFDGAAIAAREARYRFARDSATVVVTLAHPSGCVDPVRGSFCVAARLDTGVDPGGGCGVAFLTATLADGIRRDPSEYTWFVAAEGEGLPSPWGLPSIEQVLFGILSGVMLFLFVTVLVILVRERPWRALSRGELVALTVCVALAAAARLAVEPFPADMALATEQAFGIPSGHRWAAGYSALLHALFAVFPPSLDTAAMANVALGCASVVALYAFVALYLEDRLAALASAAILACQPISIRFSASDSAHVLLTLGLLMALTCTTLWMRRGGYLWAMQAAGWLVVCANSRTEGAAFVAVVVCVVGGLSPRHVRATNRQLGAAVLLGVVGMGTPLVRMVSEAVLSQTTGGVNWAGGLINPFLLSPHSPLAMIPFAVIGVYALLKGERRRAGLFLMLSMVISAVPTHVDNGLYRDALCENPHRHCLPLLAMYSIVAGVGLAWIFGPAIDRLLSVAGGARLRLLRVLRPVLVVTTAALVAIPHLGFLTRAWTHQLEFEFLQANLGRVEDGATIIGIGQRDDHIGLGAIPALSHEVGRSHDWLELRHFLTDPVPDGELVFIENAACHSNHRYAPAEAHADGLYAECREVMESFVLEPIAKTAVPAVPYFDDNFLVDPIPLGIYRIVGPVTADSEP